MRYYAKMEKRDSESLFDYCDSERAEIAKAKLEQKHQGYKAKGLGEYLVESKMYFYLKEFFPTVDIIYDKPLSGETVLTRNINPDFRIESVELQGVETKLIIEFDGAQHYTSAFESLKDIKKDEIYKEKGYTVIRFPYFIQLKREIVDCYFGKNFTCDNSYKHGFVDKKAVLLADFCSLGVDRFENEMIFYNSISNNIVSEIISTIKDKIEDKKRTNSKWSEIIEKSVINDKQIEILNNYGW